MRGIVGTLLAGAVAAQELPRPADPAPSLEPIAASSLSPAPLGETAGLELALHVQFAPDSAGIGPPALVWLRRDILATRPEWPRGRDPLDGFVLHLRPGTMRVLDAPAALPPEVYGAGQFSLPGVGTVLVGCDRDGIEDWYVPLDATLPPDLRGLLRALGPAAAGAGPGRVDAAALLGNLAPAAADGDPAATLGALGAAFCGEVTWTTWTTKERGGCRRVRGRSAGGLLLPAFLVWSAASVAKSNTTTEALESADVERWRLRAFTARDGDRAEAVRQLSRAGPAGIRALRALLFGDDDCRVAAIDALVRLGAAAELPRIVAAADPSMPWSIVAAADAVAALWPLADDGVRAAVRVMLERSKANQLRRIDVATLAVAPTNHGAEMRKRIKWFAGFFLAGICVFGFWLRERARVRGWG